MMEQQPFITVAFVIPKSPWMIGSYIIRWVENRPFSHSVILIDDIVYEAKFPRVDDSKLEEFLQAHHIVKTYQIRVSSEERELALVKAKEYIRKIYAVESLFAIIGRKFLKMVTTKPIRGLICTEYVFRVLRESGITKRDDINPDTIDLIQLESVVVEVQFRR